MAINIRGPVFLALVVTSVALSMVITGCAAQAQAPETPGVTPARVASDTQLLVVPSAELEERLSANALRDTIEAYWRAHRQRDWAGRYRMEWVDLTEKFYVQYHEKAWPIRRVEMLSMAIESDHVRTRARLVFEHPVSGDERVVYRDDLWRQIEGVWKHVFDDPLVTGFHPR